MNYGRFFSLDVNASQLTDGLTVFNYRVLQNSKASSEADLREKYPIYVTLSKEGISFHMHYIKEKNETTVHHTNSLILSLPVSTNLSIKDNLTRNIIEIFRNKFPSNAKENLIYDYAAASIKNTEQHHKGITYSSLEAFGINYTKPLIEDRPPIIGFLRKLFLDFLYDMEHTDIFKNASAYEMLYVALNENFLYQAIRNKAEYYYQRKLTAQLQKEQVYKESYERDLLAAEYYVEAERRWVETIIDPRSEVYFHNARGWFADTEAEMDAIYQSGRIKYNGGKSIVKIESYIQTKRCVEFVNSIRCPFLIEGSERERIKESLGRYKGTIVDTAKKASNWYIHKYSFSGTLNIWYGKAFKVRATLITVLFLTLLCSILWPRIGTEYLYDDAVIISFSIVGVLASGWIVNSFNQLCRVGSINIAMPRLFAAIVAAWFTLAIGEDVFKGFFDNIHNWWTSFALVLITYIFVFYEIGKLNPFISLKKKMIRSVALISMAFAYSFLAGLLVVHFFGGKYLERSDYINEFYTNHIYVESPELKMDNVPGYIQKHFYEQIGKYDSALLDTITKLKVGYDTTKLDSELIADYLTKIKYPLVCKKIAKRNDSEACIDSVEYGKTLLLLSIFTSGGGDSSDKINELHQHMMDGSLVGHRIKKVREYIRNQKELVLDSVKLGNLNVSYKRKIATDEDTISDYSWIELLKSVDNHALYRETLKNLKKSDNSTSVLSVSRLGINVFRELLIQFAFFAMFIGIFLQLIFEEKPVTEPI